MRWTPLQAPILEKSGQLRLACMKPRMLMNSGRWLSSSCTEVPDHLKCVQEIHHSTLLSTTWASAPLPSRMHLLVWIHSTAYWSAWSSVQGLVVTASSPTIRRENFLFKSCLIAMSPDSYTTNQRAQKCSVYKCVFSPQSRTTRGNQPCPHQCVQPVTSCTTCWSQRPSSFAGHLSRSPVRCRHSPCV